MSRKIKAIVFPKANEIEFRELELAVCGPDEIIVETWYTMISSGTETRVWQGHYYSADQFPFIPGYSSIGKVVETGRDVKDFAVGDIVTGRDALPIVGINQRWGGQASHHRFATKGVIAALKLPPGVEPKDYLVMEIAAISWRGVKSAQPAKSDIALVNGQGLIGALVAAFLVIEGAKTIVTDVAANRLQRAIARGASAAVNARDPDFAAQLKAILPHGADIVVEAAGNPAAVKNAISFLRWIDTEHTGPTPRLVMQANYIEPVNVNLAGFAPPRKFTLLYPCDRQTDDRMQVCAMIKSGKLRSADFVDQILPVSEAKTAYSKLKDKPDELFSVAFDWRK